MNHNSIPKAKGNYSNNTTTDSQTHINGDTTLTANEKEKFNALKTGLDTVIINMNASNKKTKYKSFIDWLSNNPQKKKELANAFTTVYDFLEEQRIKQSSTLTNEQLIINTLNCALSAQNNSKCTKQTYSYQTDNIVYRNINKIDNNTNFKNMFRLFFTSLLNDIDNNSTNENILEEMKKHFLEPFPSIAIFIGIDKYEEAVRKTLNDSQRQGLDLLKQAFNNNKKLLYEFFTLNKDKLKAILEHIGSEFAKCSGDDAKINIFKEDIGKYFDTIRKINSRTSDEFKNQVTIGCK